MNSHNANLFLAIQATIAALHDEQNKKYFPYVNQDFGQLEYYTPPGRPAVAFPCVLIDIDETEWSSMSQNTQQGFTRIKLRIGFPPYSSSSNITPDDVKEKALYYHDLEQILHQALQGKAPVYLDDQDQDVLADVFGHFNRIHSVTEKREDFIRVRELTYTIGHDDFTTKRSYITVPAQPIITAEFTE